MAVISPPALQRFFAELRRQAPAEDAAKMVLSGIAAEKSGYHNSRENHERGRDGGDPDDYSIQLAIDRQGSAVFASAIDITFTDAQDGDFRTIAKYASRLNVAYRNEDPRLFFNGERVWREFFGNTDLDRDVEGWSLYRERFASSDPSHLWHIHQSAHRKFANNFVALAGALDILLGRPLLPLEEDMDQVTFTKYLEGALESSAKVRELVGRAVWDHEFDEVGAWNGITAKATLVGISGKGDANKARDQALAAAVVELDADVEDIADRLPPASPAAAKMLQPEPVPLRRGELDDDADGNRY